MGRSPQLSAAALSLRLQSGGPATALALAAASGVDRSTVSRRLGEVGDRVMTFGAGRRTRYALRRNIRGSGDRWPLYRIDETGRARPWATLHALHGGWGVEWAVGVTPPDWARAAGAVDALWEGLPFFCDDLRPQGFLGRALARRFGEGRGLPADPTNWSDDDTWSFLTFWGEDLPGNVVVGDVALERLLGLQAQPDGGQSLAVAEVDYPSLARQAMAGDVAGSSAGGEQPKFLTAVATPAGSPQRVLVKFTAPLDNPAAGRWADLLAAEAHAHAVLAGVGLSIGGARMLDADGRRFLEVPRFDRVGLQGRRGVISLTALGGGFVAGDRSDWINRVEALRRAELVDTAGLEIVRRLACFGALIGNTDMHAGNLAFWFDDTLPFRPAPAYDMLPMRWAPTVQGELRAPSFTPSPPLPALHPAWSEAAGWAENFWQRVANDTARVSPDFRSIAESAGATVRRLRRDFG